eukprot:jgi/Tetstr1/464879/TSEL_009616.t1
MRNNSRTEPPAEASRDGRPPPSSAGHYYPSEYADLNPGRRPPSAAAAPTADRVRHRRKQRRPSPYESADDSGAADRAPGQRGGKGPAELAVLALDERNAASEAGERRGSGQPGHGRPPPGPGGGRDLAHLLSEQQVMGARACFAAELGAIQGLRAGATPPGTYSLADMDRMMFAGGRPGWQPSADHDLDRDLRLHRGKRAMGGPEEDMDKRSSARLEADLRWLGASAPRREPSPWEAAEQPSPREQRAHGGYALPPGPAAAACSAARRRQDIDDLLAQLGAGRERLFPGGPAEGAARLAWGWPPASPYASHPEALHAQLLREGAAAFPAHDWSPWRMGAEHSLSAEGRWQLQLNGGVPGESSRHVRNDGEDNFAAIRGKEVVGAPDAGQAGPGARRGGAPGEHEAERRGRRPSPGGETPPRPPGGHGTSGADDPTPREAAAPALPLEQLPAMMERVHDKLRTLHANRLNHRKLQRLHQSTEARMGADLANMMDAFWEESTGGVSRAAAAMRDMNQDIAHMLQLPPAPSGRADARRRSPRAEQRSASADSLDNAPLATRQAAGSQNKRP